MLNRGATMQAVAQAIAAGSGDEELAVLVVRGRRTRETELSLGYAVADALAAAMEAKLVASLRAQDTVLRIGEHAFVVLLPGVRGRQHAALAAAKLVRALGQPLMLEGWQLHPSVTVGLALYPSDGADADTLCLHADQACHEARNEADGFAFWHRPVHADSFTHDELRDALARNQLELYLQPVLDLHGSRISGYEALARWNHPRIGMVPPPAFVGEAEHTGLIGELTRWSLTVALRHLAQLRREGHMVRMNVNLSVVALQMPGFALQVMDLLRVWQVPPAALALEVTESALMRDVVRAQGVLAELHDEGIRISIDDFGTGYSSMAYLQRLPTDELKIDRSFVIDIATSDRARHLVGTMVDLGHNLGLEVVAEGVEDEATLALLRDLGCDRAQGYVIGRPRPATDIVSAAGV
ncbi:putative bifunctional diguanylate cyclase/phosphodiesterase [Luteimonas sp. MHLX1A]|uniref:putative bifunctional diguanylate cyclase/phosphodiesterase n=1 Tax=Alterluteimonas muca TaxID=2878684 RepID=UPI001E463F2C|nr:GGDEF domain-containing phosphodiesterase [Luteimonas sp. MHLX1A]